MTTVSRFRHDRTEPNGWERGTPEVDVTEANEDEVACCCFKSKSKPIGERKTHSAKRDAVNETPEEQGEKGKQSEHSSNGSNKKVWLDHHTEPSNSPRWQRDIQGINKKITYEELDHLKEAKNEVKKLSVPDHGNSDGSPPTKSSSLGQGRSPAGKPKSSLGSYSSEDEKQKSDFTKNKGKGNNGSNGGRRSDPTEKSTFEQAPPPLKEKQKVNSTFEHAGPPPRKEKESNLPKHSYEDPYKDPVHRLEYNQENHKNTRQDLTKKESSSP